KEINQDANTSTYFSQKQQKRQQRKLERQIEHCERQIEELESQISHIEEQLTQPEVFNDPLKASKFANQKSETEQKLEQIMLEWEKLQEKL
ncbi:MAG: ABC transporter C-terminal domain-containing protein, partial [Staphylococcus sp.]|nr:ABC transporter C-terminal domain-containing protein [Staphylococcus sp.]